MLSQSQQHLLHHLQLVDVILEFLEQLNHLDYLEGDLREVYYLFHQLSFLLDFHKLLHLQIHLDLMIHYMLTLYLHLQKYKWCIQLQQKNHYHD